MLFTDYFLFAMIAVAQVGSPGPSTMCLVNNARVYGPGRAVWILTADLVAVAVLASCALLGVDALLLASADVFAVVKFAGASYLLWLGIQQFRMAQSGRVNVTPYVTREPMSVMWGKSFKAGIGNLRAILFFLALLPQFIGSSQGSQAGEMLSLILLFVLIKFLVSSAYALTANTRAQRPAKPRAALWGKRATGSILVVFGLVMGVTAFA